MNRRGAFGALVALVLAAIAALVPAQSAAAQSRDLGAIAGAVIHRRAPVENAVVVLSNADGPVARATTNARGMFEFPAVRPGRYHLTASKADVGTGAADAAVLPGDTTRVRIELANRAPGALTGVAVFEGAPVADAVVIVRRGGEEVARSVTTADGRFGFRELRPGAYMVEAVKRGVGAGVARAEILAGQTTSVRIQLRGEPPASGAVAGLVSASAGPAAEAVVILRNERGEVARTTTNAQGRYGFRNVRPGVYSVTAAKRGAGEGAVRVTVTAGQVAQADITLRLPPQAGAVAGIVVSANGPVADANVTIALNGVIVARATSGRDGSFSFPNLRPGTYLVQAARREVGAGRAEAVVTAGQTTSIRVRLQ